jgi:hypothetical protein
MHFPEFIGISVQFPDFCKDISLHVIANETETWKNKPSEVLHPRFSLSNHFTQRVNRLTHFEPSSLKNHTAHLIVNMEEVSCYVYMLKRKL